MHKWKRREQGHRVKTRRWEGREGGEERSWVGSWIRSKRTEKDRLVSQRGWELKPNLMQDSRLHHICEVPKSYK